MIKVKMLESRGAGAAFYEANQRYLIDDGLAAMFIHHGYAVPDDPKPHLQSSGDLARHLKQHQALGIYSGRRQFLYQPRSQVTTSASSNISRHGVMVLPHAEWEVLQFRLLNADLSPRTYKLSWLNPNGVGDGLYSNSPGWVAALFSASSSVVVPAATDEFTLGFADSDPVFIPSVSDNLSRTVLALRTFCNTGPSSRVVLANSNTDLESGYMVGARHSGGADITNNHAIFSPIYDGFFPPVSIRGWSRKEMRQIYSFLGSAGCGGGDTISAGWQHRLPGVMSNQNRCIFVANRGHPNMRTETAFNKAMELLATTDAVDDIIVRPSAGDDDVDPDFATPAYVERQKWYWLQLADAAARRSPGTRVWVCAEPLGVGVVDPAEFSIRTECVNQARRFAAGGGIGLIDSIAHFQYPSSVGGGQWINPLDTDDGRHWSAYGHDRMAKFAARALDREL